MIPTKALLIGVDGAVSRVTYDDLDSLQALVGGYVEIIKLGRSGAFAYVNEDGIALKLSANPEATRLCVLTKTALLPWDHIKGPMVVVGPPDDDGEDGDVPEDFVRTWYPELNTNPRN